MWSNFFMQEEDRRRAAAGRRRAQVQQGVLLTPEQEGKIKLVLLLVSVGATLAVLAVGTEFWVELNTYKANSSAVCDAAHLGLWKVCTKRLWLADVPAGRETCGPAELPGGERPALTQAPAPQIETEETMPQKEPGPPGESLHPRKTCAPRDSTQTRPVFLTGLSPGDLCLRARLPACTPSPACAPRPAGAFREPGNIRRHIPRTAHTPETGCAPVLCPQRACVPDSLPWRQMDCPAVHPGQTHHSAAHPA